MHRTHNSPLKQSGISMIEMLIANVMAIAIIMLILVVSDRIQSAYLVQQSLAYRQTILQNGWWSMVQSIKRISTDFTYEHSSRLINAANPTGAFLYFRTNNTLNNNIVFGSKDFVKYPILPKELITTSQSGPSNVNLPSDQLVIQYTTSIAGLKDCEGTPILPYENTSTAETVIERYYVRYNNTEARLDLVCDAGRYNPTVGFTGIGDAGQTVIPNVDFFKVVLTVVDVYQSSTGSRHDYAQRMAVDAYNAEIRPDTPNIQTIRGVDIGVLFHSPIPTKNYAKSPPKNSYCVLSDCVTLNGNLSNSSVIFDQASSAIAINYVKEQ